MVKKKIVVNYCIFFSDVENSIRKQKPLKIQSGVAKRSLYDPVKGIMHFNCIFLFFIIILFDVKFDFLLFLYSR